MNDLPAVQDRSFAFWERVRIVPFDRTFQAGERDPLLPEKLAAEYQGILAWLVRGAVEYFERGLRDIPDRVASATSEYQKKGDTILMFLAARCVAEKGATVAPETLYKAYEKWGTEAGLQGYADDPTEKLLSGTAFGRAMKEHFKQGRFTIDGKRTNLYIGLRLLPEAEEAEAP